MAGKKYVWLHSTKLKWTYACTVYYYNILKKEGVGGGGEEWAFLAVRTFVLLPQSELEKSSALDVTKLLHKRHCNLNNVY